jgi:hypothetical protein
VVDNGDEVLSAGWRSPAWWFGGAGVQGVVTLEAWSEATDQPEARAAADEFEWSRLLGLNV